MPGTPISLEGVPRILEHVFAQPAVDVLTSESEPSEMTQRFDSELACVAYFRKRVEDGSSFIAFAVHYLETGGYVQDRRVSLDPQKCKGHTFRYSVGGWGVIHVQLHVGSDNLVGCSITVNSEKRANAWFATYPEFRDPDLWNWQLVTRHARRLQRQLKRLAQQTIPADRAKARAG